MVRKREIAKQRVKRKLWKPYSRKKSAIGGLERTRSATKVSSSVQNKVSPENTEIQTVVMEDASASFSTTESIDSIPTLRQVRRTETVQASKAKTEVNPGIVERQTVGLQQSTEELVKAPTGVKDKPLELRKGVEAHLDNHTIPSVSVLPADEPTTLLISTPTTTVQPQPKKQNPARQEKLEGEKPVLWTSLTSQRTTDFIKNYKVNSKSPPLNPSININQRHASILRNIPIPVTSSSVWEPSPSLHQTLRVPTYVHTNTRNSLRSPTFFSTKSDLRPTNSIRVKTVNSLENPGMAVYLPFPQPSQFETPKHVKQDTTPSAARLSRYPITFVNSRGSLFGRRVDGASKIRPFPQFTTFHSGVRQGRTRPCLRTRKIDSGSTTGNWFNLF